MQARWKLLRKDIKEQVRKREAAIFTVFLPEKNQEKIAKRLLVATLGESVGAALSATDVSRTVSTPGVCVCVTRDGQCLLARWALWVHEAQQAFL